jgi:hypothetical protein
MSNHLSKILGGAKIFGYDAIFVKENERVAVIDVNDFPNFDWCKPEHFFLYALANKE